MRELSLQKPFVLRSTRVSKREQPRLRPRRPRTSGSLTPFETALRWTPQGERDLVIRTAGLRYGKPPNMPTARIGDPVRRREDLRLITGRGCFSDDVNLPRQVYAAMVRSPYAHARIVAIDSLGALSSPGVLAVLTGRDWRNDGLKPLPHQPYSFHPAERPLANRDGAPVFMPPHYPLTHDKARYSGEAVAIVIAESI